MTRRQAAATTATRKSRQVEAMKGIKYMKKKKGFFNRTAGCHLPLLSCSKKALIFLRLWHVQEHI